VTSLNLALPLKPYEVMKAVEEKDIIFLMEIRDKAFPVSSILILGVQLL
jgi:hypothetical protein